MRGRDQSQKLPGQEQAVAFECRGSMVGPVSIIHSNLNRSLADITDALLRIEPCDPSKTSCSAKSNAAADLVLLIALF